MSVRGTQKNTKGANKDLRLKARLLFRFYVAAGYEQSEAHLFNSDHGTNVKWLYLRQLLRNGK